MANCFCFGKALPQRSGDTGSTPDIDDDTLRLQVQLAGDLLFPSLAPRALQHLATRGLSAVVVHLNLKATVFFRSYTSSPCLICAPCGLRLIRKGLAIGLVVESGGVRALERRRNEAIRRIRFFLVDGSRPR